MGYGISESQNANHFHFPFWNHSADLDEIFGASTHLPSRPYPAVADHHSITSRSPLAKATIFNAVCPKMVQSQNATIVRTATSARFRICKDHTSAMIFVKSSFRHQLNFQRSSRSTTPSESSRQGAHEYVSIVCVGSAIPFWSATEPFFIP